MAFRFLENWRHGTDGHTDGEQRLNYVAPSRDGRIICVEP